VRFKIQAFLDRCDLVKFAKYRPEMREAQIILEDAFGPRGPHPVEAGAAGGEGGAGGGGGGEGGP